MDIHIVDSKEFSAEDVVKAHMEDLAIQDKYGVKQLKYWVNEDAKTIFCLMQGPDREACHQVHLMSHGNTACNIIEVSDDEYNLYMGQGTDVDDLARTDNGTLDTGYRSILLANIICIQKSKKDYFNKANGLIKNFNGTLVLEPNHQIMASFVSAHDAICCAASIKDMLEDAESEVQFNMAVVSGRPVDEKGKVFFEETKRRVNGICSLGLNMNIYLDTETITLSAKESPDQKGVHFKYIPLDSEDLSLFMTLSDAVKMNFTRSEFSSADLFTALGLSKSKANRKIKALTGFSPNQLIQESRLQNALDMISRKRATMSEVAYGSGFNSPAYFTQVFRRRFGITPSAYSRLLA